MGSMESDSPPYYNIPKQGQIAKGHASAPQDFVMKWTMLLASQHCAKKQHGGVSNIHVEGWRPCPGWQLGSSGHTKQLALGTFVPNSCHNNGVETLKGPRWSPFPAGYLQGQNKTTEKLKQTIRRTLKSAQNGTNNGKPLPPQHPSLFRKEVGCIAVICFPGWSSELWKWICRLAEPACFGSSIPAGRLLCLHWTDTWYTALGIWFV